MHGCFAVFTRRSGADFAAEFLAHKLHSVANAKHGHAEVEQLIGAGSCAFKICTVRPAGQNNTAQTVAFDLFDRGIRRQELAVNPCFTHSACNELVILRSEIDDYNSLHIVFLI